MNKTIFLVVIALLSLSSCYYNSPGPYIIFKDTYAEVITEDTVDVAVNSRHELLVEAGSDGHSFQYLTQKNEEEVIDISDSELIQHSSSGWDGNLSYKNVIVKSSFPDSLYTSGDVLRLTVRFSSNNSWFGRSIFYRVN